MNHPKLVYNQFYHIYNRGINGCDLFRELTNYEHFLGIYDKYISPVANTYAWVLMGNHFHFLIKIKGKSDIQNLQGFRNLEGLKENGRNRINQQFSNLFNAYTKAYNKKYDRTGSLFEHPFRRIKVTSNSHLKYLVYYIHHNPVHHGFCDQMDDYPWSSYLTILSPKQTRLKRSEVLNWYNNMQSYNDYHNRQSLQKFRELHIDIPYKLI